MPGGSKILLVSTGDAAGVGPEICLKALKEVGRIEGIRFLPVGDWEVLRHAASLVRFPDPVRRLESLDEAGREDGACGVLHVGSRAAIERGRVSAEAGRHAFEILETCSGCCLRGEAAGLVTGPINKESMKLAGYGGWGHTEALAGLAGVADVETVFVLEGLRIFFLSRHVSLREALGLVRKDRILSALLRMDRMVKEAGVERPRLGVPALNPHSGDGGVFGREEIDEIEPAVREAVERGLDVQGPIAADSIFHLALEGRMDAVLALFHDQGHVAAKTRNFHGTITQTFGLPYVRTSVDHGTGFDIAWKGVANPESMIRALRLAADLIRR